MNSDLNVAPVAISGQKEQVIPGLVGAFLFSLVGGVIWFVLYMMGYLAAISGIVGVVCAIKGYAVFAKKESLKGVILSSVIAVLVLIFAWYLSVGYSIYDAYQAWFEAGEVDFTLSFFESVQTVPFFFMNEPDFFLGCLGDLGLGLLFCLIGAFTPVKNAIQRVKAEHTPIAPAQVVTVPNDRGMPSEEISKETEEKKE